ncbi:MAG: CDP-alcohol phosphatidyltransferase family protein [Actinobacteria bacterium]|nr:CDP-alcohol phosphatidyltransferase family protein [Actinomycetota bacterium]MCL5887620.1 CDP-alcohol phosphatidyltransferase family protein [Actinomycetota bacterium]
MTKKPTAVEREATNSESDVWTVANVITILRLMLVPFSFTVLIRDDGSDILAFALYASAAATDWIDGQIARRTSTVTAIGKAIDPLVDRLLIASGVIGLYMVDRLPLPILALLVLRDVYLLYGAWRLERHQLRMPVTLVGKATTAVLFVGLSLMILNWPYVTISDDQLLLGLIIVYIGAVMSASTAIHYTVLAKRLVRGHTS